MTEVKAQQFTVEPDPGDPGSELSLRKLDLYGIPVTQIAFGNDTNTYLSFRSVVGGTMTEHMVVDANGNVGIGIASAGEKLEVSGTVKATAFNGDGLNLTNLDGSQIANGTISDARLPLSISRTADVDARFDPVTGHKHTGAVGEGSQISHSTLIEIVGADPGSTDAQTNKHVSNAQSKVWQDHVGITSGNPHGTTAAQVGAPVSVEGVSNPGGNIDLVNSNTITITGNNTTKQITIGETHSARTDNPHATTAAQVGAPVSIEGITNAGGDIDLVNSDSITIAGNNTTKQITIGETHSARTDNPHATSADQIDNQGGTNRITTQINAGTGTINEARIDAAIARDSEVTAKFDVTNGHDHDGVDSKRIPAVTSTYFASLDGSSLTNLNGSQITTGTVAAARIDTAILRSSALAVPNGIATLDTNTRLVQSANTLWDGTTGRSASQTPAANTIAVTQSNGRLAFGFKPSYRGALVIRSFSTYIPTAAYTTLNWDVDEYDTDNVHDTVTNNSRLKVPSGVTRVKVGCNITWAGNATGMRRVIIYKNGTSYNGMPFLNNDASAEGNFMNLWSSVINVSSTDYFEVAVYQSSGTSLLVPLSNATWFGMEIVE